MGYRDNWLNHAGAIAVHSEATLHAFDRTIPIRPLSLLLIGVGNGGVVEIWRDTLPEGSKITALDADERCSELPGLNVLHCDVTDRDTVRKTLKGEWFDIAIDSTHTMTANAWPFVRAGGAYIYEGYTAERITRLVADLATEQDSWLPIEEVMRVDVFQTCAVIEKRTPRVVPYLEVVTGNFGDVIPESVYQQRGAKRVIPA